MSKDILKIFHYFTVRKLIQVIGQRYSDLLTFNLLLLDNYLLFVYVPYFQFTKFHFIPSTDVMDRSQLIFLWLNCIISGFPPFNQQNRNLYEIVCLCNIFTQDYGFWIFCQLHGSTQLYKGCVFWKRTLPNSQNEQ